MSYQVFLSHNSADKFEVEAIARKLEGVGVRCWFDAWSLHQGEQWLDGLEEGMKSVEAVAVFFGRSGMGPWQELERRLALLFSAEAVRTGRHFRIIPVRLPGAPEWQDLPLSPFLRLYPGVHFTSVTDNKALTLLKLGVEGAQLGAPGTTAKDAPPYVGMRPFSESDSHLFFGRHEEMVEIAERLADTAPPRFHTILGASGSGKSSLVFGGLLPLLRAGRFPGLDSRGWIVLAMQPGQNAIASLRSTMAGQDALRPLLPEFSADGARPGSSALDHVVTASLGNTDSSKRLLLVVDQFETLFTQQPEDTKLRKEYRDQILEPFLSLLTSATSNPTGPVTVIVTARSDFFGALADEPLLKDFVENHRRRLIVQPLEGQRLRDVIERPALALGADFEEGLVEAIIEDFIVQPAGALPFLQEALSRVWELRQIDETSSHPLLTLAAYVQIGRLRGALDAHAERVWQKLSADNTLASAAVPVLLHLVRLGEGGEPDTKRRVPIDNLPSGEIGRRFALRLTEPDARLVTSDDSAALGADSIATVEFSHEALLKGWHRLRAWLNDPQQRPRRLKLRHWEASARAWKRGGDDAPRLLSAAELRPLRLLAQHLPGEAPPILQDYIETSQKTVNARRRIVALAACAIAALGFLAWNFFSQRAAEIAHVDRLVEASSSTSLKPDLRLLLADQALARCKPELRPKIAFARLQASIDLGPSDVDLLRSYWFGQRAPWNFRRDPFHYTKFTDWMNLGEVSGDRHLAPAERDDPGNQKFMIDPLGRWAYYLCPIGFIRYDLHSLRPDFGAGFYYWPSSAVPQGIRIATSHDGEITAASCRGSWVAVWEAPGIARSLLDRSASREGDSVVVEPAGKFIVVGNSIFRADAKTGSEPIKTLPKTPIAVSDDGRFLLGIDPPQDALPPPPPLTLDADGAPSPDTLKSQSNAVKRQAIIYSWDLADNLAEQKEPVASADEIAPHLFDGFHPRFLAVREHDDFYRSLALAIRDLSPEWEIHRETLDKGDSSGIEGQVTATCRRRHPKPGTADSITVRLGVPANNPEQPAVLSTNGRWFAAVSGTELKVWNLSRPELSDKPSFKLTSLNWDTLRFSPDGRWLAAGDSRTGPRSHVVLFDMTTTGETRQVKVPVCGDNRDGSFYDFCPDSRWFVAQLFTGFNDDLGVRLWDLDPKTDHRLQARTPTDDEQLLYTLSKVRAGSSAEDDTATNQAAKLVGEANELFKTFGGDGEELAAAKVPDARKICIQALEKLKEARRLNPTLFVDPALHVGCLAEYYFRPKLSTLAEEGHLDASRQLLGIIKEYHPQTLQTDDGLDEAAARHWRSHAFNLAKTLDATGAKAAVDELKKIKSVGIDQEYLAIERVLSMERFNKAIGDDFTTERLAETDKELQFLVSHPLTNSDRETFSEREFRERQAMWMFAAASKTHPEILNDALSRLDRLNAENKLHDEKLNSLCWNLALNGQAALAVGYGEQAMASSSSHQHKDSLAVALAVNGELKRAADLFQSLLDERTSVRTPKVLGAWIARLRAGASPFTPPIIAKLKDGRPSEADLLKDD